MKKIVFCGGGTAGHVMPNIAIIEQLLKRNIEIHYIGSNGIEKRILSNYPQVKYHEISCPKLIRKLTLKNLTIPFRLIKSINHCKQILKEIKPNVIFSKGGYVSVPVVMSAQNIPVIGHESDYTMGLANKIIYHYTNKMFFSFSDTAHKYYKKGEFSGTAIRNSVFQGNKLKLKKELGIINSKPNILIVGGSTGAKAINDFIFTNIEILTKNYNVIHITGKQHSPNNSSKETCNPYFQNKIDGYHPIEYVDNMGDYLALADYIISRAGSNAIFEFLALKKLMLLIPLPKEESRGDQLLNAKYFEEQGFAEVLQQKDLTITNLNKKLDSLKANKSKIFNTMSKSNKQNGTKIIVSELLSYLK